MALRFITPRFFVALEKTASSLFGSRAIHTASVLSHMPEPEKSEKVKESIPNKIWKIGKLNHVAIAVPDIDKATVLYRDVLGARVSEKHAVPDHGVYTVFVKLGDTTIELLQPLGEHSPIDAFLKRHHSGGLHHICIEVSNVHEAMEDLKSHDVHLIGEPREGAHGKPVIFIHPKDCNGTLVELEQE